MSERPILFSAPMVRAILDGRKTQTRRVVKPQPSDGWAPESPPVLGRVTSPHPRRGRFGVFLRRGLGTDFPEFDLVPCPYGQPGDRLWVKEAWQAWDRISHEYDEWEPWSKEMRDGLTFADYHTEHGPPDSIEYRASSKSSGPWNASMFMPRWASRITLEVTGVRVERLQEISHEDAELEGVVCNMSARTFRDHFRALWESIHGPGSWEANPWVWVIEFKRVASHAQ